MSATSYANVSQNVHPMVIFCVGALTSALVVGLVLFYKTLAPMDYSSSVINDKHLSPYYN